MSSFAAGGKGRRPGRAGRAGGGSGGKGAAAQTSSNRPSSKPTAKVSGGPTATSKPKVDKTARKMGRRQAQLQKMAEKAAREDADYTGELRKHEKLSQQHGGFIPRSQKTSEAALFEKQSAAGINFDQYDAIKVELSGKGANTFQPLTSFSADLEKALPKFLSRNIGLMRYERPTPIQSYALPIALKRRDLMCCAQTGSGKTCAFLLPVVLSLSAGPKKKWADHFHGKSCAPAALILAPTRELAMQIEVECEKLCNGASGVSSSVVYGGASARTQLVYLAKGMDILVATPGRLQDFVDRSLVSLQKIQFLILDEADRMLDMGFEPQIRKLVQKSGMPGPGARQTMMFSATFPPPMQKLAAEFLSEYIWIGVGRVGSTVSSITQRLVLANNNKREKLLLLKDALGSTRAGARTLIFVKKKSSARWVSKQLRKPDGDFGGITSAEIHGDRSQSQRESALAAFRDGTIQILVATDVAARGLDVDGVEHVINFDLGATKDEFDSYVHRIGRTGRAGKTGLATAFYVPGYEPKVGCGPIAKDLLHLLKESKQTVPAWFLALPELSQRKEGSAKVASSKFGGRDVRKTETVERSSEKSAGKSSTRGKQPAGQGEAGKPSARKTGTGPKRPAAAGAGVKKKKAGDAAAKKRKTGRG